jgi:hypothetical protein
MPCAARGGAEAAVRIVLDTNVVLSALLWRGTPYRLFDAISTSSPTELTASPIAVSGLPVCSVS